MVEPQTSEIGHIERAVREFELTAGLIDATDRAALATLDVIVLPHLSVIRRDLLEAVLAAVSGGVGLYNLWWKGFGGTLSEDDALIKKVMLSASPIVPYHTPEGHGWPVPATVWETHAVIAGLAERASILVAGCGPLYRPVAGAKVLITQDRRVTGHGIPGLGAVSVPVLITGKIGKGRVVVDHQGFPALLNGHPALKGEMTGNVLEWLAEGRRGWKVE
jgi:hypothetical protein